MTGPPVRFRDRADAGRRLAEALLADRPRGDVVVLGLPRGGVPVAFEVARALVAPLDVVVVRKLGVPYQPELAFGAVAENAVRVLDDEVARAAGLRPDEVTRVESHERAELASRIARLRSVRPEVPLDGRTALVVDDGLATGSTAHAACLAARARGAERVVLAVPVGPRSAVTDLATVADEVEALVTPDPFLAVGQWYEEFGATSDDEVAELLRRSLAWSSPSEGPQGRPMSL